MKDTHGQTLDRLELHHLRALERLLTTRSVTRSAEQLGLTQSAVSHSLRQLREVLGDPLFVRKGDRLELTPRAETMIEPLRQAMRDLNRALATGTEWNPKESRRSFMVVMPDTHALTIVPALLRRLRDDAPGVDLDVRAPPEGRAELGLLTMGADAAIVVRNPELPGVMGTTLFEEEFACLVRRDHPEVGSSLDLDTFCRLGHALTSPQGGGPSVVDTALHKLGRSRRVMLRIAYFLAAPLMVAESDLILTAPRRLAEQFVRMAPLKILPPPLPVPPFPVRMLWPEKLTEDPAHRWLREALKEAAQGFERRI